MTLEAFQQALESDDEIAITVTGRKSGRQISLPVWFVQEGDRLYLLPVSGSDSQWYNNVLKTPSIRLAANGITWNATARPITDAARVRDVVEKFRAKYGAGLVRQYYSKLDVAVEIPLG